MSDDIDIVDRLRINWTSLTDKQNAERNEAVDEIERLRRNTGCARNQRSTQFCAEALDAQRDVETLKAELVRNADEFRETLTAHRRTIECLTAERDSTIRELRTVETECSMLRVECGVIASERDEARRDQCMARAVIRWDLEHPNSPQRSETTIILLAWQIADEQGWDCFKEPADAP